jgi:flagellar FlgN protein
MKASGLTIESLYQEKIVLYQDLIDALETERKSIIDIDVDALWKISDQKSRIARKIEKKQQQILAHLEALPVQYGADISPFDTQRILDLLPEEIKGRLKKVSVLLRTLKEEIRARLKENRGFVGEYLGILDEIIGVVAGAGKQNPVYNRGRRAGNPATRLFLHREV